MRVDDNRVGGQRGNPFQAADGILQMVENAQKEGHVETSVSLRADILQPVDVETHIVLTARFPDKLRLLDITLFRIEPPHFARSGICGQHRETATITRNVEDALAV